MLLVAKSPDLDVFKREVERLLKSREAEQRRSVCSEPD